VTRRFSARRSVAGEVDDAVVAADPRAMAHDEGTREFGGDRDPAAVRHLDGTVVGLDAAGRPMSRGVELRVKVNTDTQKGAPRPWDRVAGVRPGADHKPNEGLALGGVPLLSRAGRVDGTVEFAGAAHDDLMRRGAAPARVDAVAPRARSEGARVRATSARISDATRMAVAQREAQMRAFPYEQLLAWTLAGLAVGLAILVAAT